MNKWKRNIILILVIRICYSMLFCISVITIYWKRYGLDLLDIFWLQAIFAVSIVVLEVPTGYIGDRLGRKKTIMLSALIAGIGWLLYAMSGSFMQFMIVEIILGMAFSLLSGTDTSLLYESLKELDNTDIYSSTAGRQQSFIFLAESASSVTGGFLAAFTGIELLMILSSISVAIGFILSLFISEPAREAYVHPRGTWYSLYKIARFVFLRSKIVRYAVPLMAVCSLSTMLGVWLYQPLWQERGIPVWLFGILWAGLSVPAAVASRFAHALEHRIGKRNIILVLPLPVVAGYLLAAAAPGKAAIIFIYLIPLLRGLWMPILSRYVHDETFSDKRATVLSIQSWLFRLGYFITGPVIGWIGRSYSLSWALAASGLLSLVLIFAFAVPVINRIQVMNHAS